MKCSKSANLSLLTGLHDLSGLVFQFLQLCCELSHRLLILLQLGLHTVHALLTFLQVAAEGTRTAEDTDIMSLCQGVRG